jgi:hypothetical protein
MEYRVSPKESRIPPMVVFRFTIGISRFTSGISRFTIGVSRFTNGDTPFTPADLAFQGGGFGPLAVGGMAMVNTGSGLPLNG